jgi:hypothetical protein
VTVYGSIYDVVNSSMTFQLDGGNRTSYNTTAASEPGFFHHQVFYQVENLNDTEHTLVMTQQTNLTDDAVICPDFITYVPSESAMTANTSYLMDDQDMRVTYSSEWTVSSGERSELMMETGTFTEVVDSTFELEFQGKLIIITPIYGSLIILGLMQA